ncbi:MAG: OmpA family protein [Treponema sp.]|nr:OmpA family protein [Treponema sp.]
MIRKYIISVFFTILIIFPVFSQFDGVSPVGANSAMDLFSPSMGGRGGFITLKGGAPASAVNPAAEGDAQRIIFDIGYLGIPGFGKESGWGNAFNLGAVFPTRVGVFGGSLKMINSPFKGFPVDTTFMGNLNAAKEFYPGMNLGAGLNIGYNTADHWIVSGDLGLRWNIGSLGPLENFTWAAVLHGIGASWIPSMFTPAGGISFDFVNLKGEAGNPSPFKMGMAADLSFPTFQNVTGKLGINMTVAGLVNVTAASNFNVREALKGQAPSFIPSIGVSANFKLKSGGPRIVGGALPSDGELAVDLAAKPLYADIWAMGAGVTWTVGVVDKNPPVITIDYPDMIWISPNNDGLSDDLEFPVSITDQRYISEWSFEIMDEAGNVVRTYRNKERRPETQGVQNFWDRLTDVKSGVEVPSTLRWDGILETGVTAPDGIYQFRVTAKDDNQNSAVSQTYKVMVDCTPPDITIEPLAGDDNIFSPDGDGYKDTLTINMNGSREDLWEGGIYSSSGNKVKNVRFANTAPQAFTWDGTDDNGVIVGDGVYFFRISSFDRAQNSGSAELRNIIVNTVQPQIGLSITDAWFSPNNDGIKDTMNFILNIPDTEGIVYWEFNIRDTRGQIRRTLKGNGIPPARYEYDGRDETGAILPESVYTADVSLRYINGYLSSAVSPSFTLDVTPPRASIRIDDKDQGPGLPPVFAPNNTGAKDELFIIQEASEEILWIGEIRNASETPAGAVKTFRFSGTPPTRLIWDGVTNEGSIAPDGLYVYELSSADLAGNTGRSNRVEFEINTRDTPVFITTDLRAFSPNGDGIKDSITLQPQIQETAGILNWRIEIYRSAGANSQVLPSPGSIVRTFTGSSMAPASIIWDGKSDNGSPVQDGSYAARLYLEYRSGVKPTAATLPFILDTEAPSGDTSVPFKIFAPNGNGRRDFLPISVNTDGNDEWNAVITDNGNNIVRSWNWIDQPPEKTLIWDGKDQAGNIVTDGVYSFSLSSTDDAGNSFRRTISSITVDGRIPRAFLTASALAIAPKPNQPSQAMNFNIIISPQEGINSWKLELKDETGSVFKTFAGVNSAPPANIGWNGNDDRGIIREGWYTPSLYIDYEKGDEVYVTAPEINVDVSGPVLNFSYRPQYFSPDNDGVDDEMFITLSAVDASPIAFWNLEFRETEGTKQIFYRWEGRGSPTDRIVWNGRSSWGELVQGATDYSYTFSATDSLGNSSTVDGIFSTDVLVIRDGDLLKIQVPSITFRANYADFIGLPADRIETNNRVLRRVAEILNRFRDYRVTVEGHANPILGTAREETEELQPLSYARAAAVVDILSGYGVNRSRMSYVGRGGQFTVANAQDQNNNWKNRRVEFILIK